MSGGVLRVLAETLRNVERGGRQHDGYVYEALGYEVKRDHGRLGYAYRGTGPLKYADAERWQSLSGLTGTIDGAERLLPPGMRYALFSDGEGKGPSAMVMRGDEPVVASGHARTTALALAATCLEAWAVVREGRVKR